MGQCLYETLVSELGAVAPIPGLLMTDILDLPDAIRQVVRWILRQKYVSLPELAAYLGIDNDTTLSVIEMLTQKGFLEESKETKNKQYRIRTSTIIHTAEHKKPTLDLWETFGEDSPKKH